MSTCNHNNPSPSGRCRTRTRVYNARPDVKARKKAHKQTQKGKATERAYRSRVKTDVVAALFAREYSRRNEARPERKAALKALPRRGVDKNAEAIRARQVLNAAVKAGKLTRLPCEKCSNPKSQGHHDDYGQPLVVRWLCAMCHQREHSDELLAKRFGISVGELQYIHARLVVVGSGREHQRDAAVVCMAAKARAGR